MTLMTCSSLTNKCLPVVGHRTSSPNRNLVVRRAATDKFLTLQKKLSEQGFNFSELAVQTIFNTIHELKQLILPLNTRRLRVVPSGPCETHVTMGARSLRVYLQRPHELGSGSSKTFLPACCLELDPNSEEVITVSEVGKLISHVPGLVPAIIDELNLTKAFNHPNIHAHIEDHYYTNEAKEPTVVIYTPLCEIACKVHLENPMMRTAIALHFLESLLNALAYLHGKNIFHNDIKLANILMSKLPDRSIHFKLTDFGLANQEFDELTHNPPPEFFLIPLGLKNATYKGNSQTDIWSLGCTLYQLYKGYELPWGPLVSVKYWLDRISLQMHTHISTDNPGATAANELLAQLSASVDLVEVTNLPFDGNPPSTFNSFLLELSLLHKKIAHLTPSETLKITLANVRQKVDNKLKQMIQFYSKRKESASSVYRDPIESFVLELLKANPAERPSAESLLLRVRQVHSSYKAYLKGIINYTLSSSSSAPSVWNNPANKNSFQKSMA